MPIDGHAHGDRPCGRGCRYNLLRESNGPLFESNDSHVGGCEAHTHKLKSPTSTDGFCRGRDQVDDVVAVIDLLPGGVLQDQISHGKRGTAITSRDRDPPIWMGRGASDGKCPLLVGMAPGHSRPRLKRRPGGSVVRVVK